MFDETAGKKRRFLRKLLLFLIPFLCLFLLLSGVYFWQRGQRPQLLLPTSAMSNDQVLQESLNAVGLRFETPFLIDGETIVASISGLTVFFSSAKDLPTQVRSLQLVLPEVKMDEEKNSIIDLRFKKTVLKSSDEVNHQ